MPAYWLMKSEPDAFSLDDLARCGGDGAWWDGVRNYQARNFMGEMACGDQVFFYHSSTPKPGIAGICEVIHTALPDPSQFDQASPYFDPRASRAAPRWQQVKVRYTKHLAEFVALKTLRSAPAALAGMPLLKKGSRLSVMPVSESQWQHILLLGGENG